MYLRFLQSRELILMIYINLYQVTGQTCEGCVF